MLTRLFLSTIDTRETLVKQRNFRNLAAVVALEDMLSDRIRFPEKEHWLALDIGGANIKLADGREYARTAPFALWKESRRLAQVLEKLLDAAPAWDHVVVTMTGELADCFATKADGVLHILQSVHHAVGHDQFLVYLVGGQLVTADQVESDPLAAAAANWHALSRYATRFTAGHAGLHIDVGSTTCDLVPLIKDGVAAQGATDTERLVLGELVYGGVERTPICALVEKVGYRRQSCPVASEWFATTLDVYLLLDDLPEDVESTETADGRSATKQAACDRLARTVCADRSTFNEEDALGLASEVARAQLARLCISANQVIESMPRPPQVVITSGRGEFLARRVAERLAPKANLVSLGDQLGPSVSTCATAHALAVLAGEECEQ